MAARTAKPPDTPVVAALLSRALGGPVALVAFDPSGRPVDPISGAAPYRAPDFALSPSMRGDLAEGRRAELVVGGQRFWALGAQGARGTLWLAIRPAGASVVLPHFAQHLVHALRNGLASIKLAAQSLARSDNVTARQHRQLDVALREVSRMERTLSTACEFARAPARRADASVDPQALLRAAVGARQDELAARGVTLALSIEPVAPLTADAHRLQLTFENLLGFGVRAMPDGGVLDVSLDMRRGAAALTVRDRGADVSAAECGALALPLASGPRGAGLDLALAAQVAAELGGALTFEPAEPGVRLTLWLGAARG